MNAARQAVRALPRGLGLAGHPAALYVGGGIVAMWLCLALFADLVAPYDPNAHNLQNFLQPPGWAHPLGTDNFGRDILSRVIHGTRVDFEIGIMGVFWPFLLGTFLGSVSGYFGGIVDIALSPTTYLGVIDPSLSPEVGLALFAGDTIDTRDRNGDLIDDVLYKSVDPYVSLRSIYLQRRRSQVAGDTAGVGALPDICDIN